MAARADIIQNVCVCVYDVGVYYRTSLIIVWNIIILVRQHMASMHANSVKLNYKANIECTFLCT